MDRLYIETKIAATEDGSISGIAWKFAQPDRIGDVILPGAFSKASFPLPILFGHDFNDPVGVWEGGQEKGGAYHLSGKLLIADVARAREVRALTVSGAVGGMSVGFITKKFKPLAGGGREIKELELLECSLVTIPMHPGAKVTSAKTAIRALMLAEAINRAAAQIAAR